MRVFLLLWTGAALACLAVRVISRLHAGYHIVLHMRDGEGNPLPPLVWNHPGPWEEVLKHLPNSGTQMGDGAFVAALEVR